MATRNLARISRRKARQFLQELANLRDAADATGRFEHNFKEFLNRDDGQGYTLAQIETGGCEESLERTITLDDRYGPLSDLREELRTIWTTPDLKVREWRIFLFGADPTVSVSLAAAIGPPVPTPFQQALVHLFKCAATMTCCSNKECPAPYFFARRKSQKFCSDICALPAQREQKRRWWSHHGEKWRKRRANVTISRKKTEDFLSKCP
jgi:hypothetical protein